MGTRQHPRSSLQFPRPLCCSGFQKIQLCPPSAWSRRIRCRMHSRQWWEPPVTPLWMSPLWLSTLRDLRPHDVRVPGPGSPHSERIEQKRNCSQGLREACVSTGKKEETAQVSPVDHRSGEGAWGRGSHDFRVSYLGEPDLPVSAPQPRPPSTPAPTWDQNPTPGCWSRR